VTIPTPPRYEPRRSDDGKCCVYDTFVQQPVAFEGAHLTWSQAIGGAGRLNRAYAMAIGKEAAQ